MMKGWKTWTGVIGMVLVTVADGMLGIDTQAAAADANTIVTMIQAGMAGLAVIGLGHKIEKAAAK